MNFHDFVHIILIILHKKGKMPNITIMTSRFRVPTLKGKKVFLLYFSKHIHE